jgi:hypothetical protein
VCSEVPPNAVLQVSRPPPAPHHLDTSTHTPHDQATPLALHLKGRLAPPDLHTCSPLTHQVLSHLCTDGAYFPPGFLFDVSKPTITRATHRHQRASRQLVDRALCPSAAPYGGVCVGIGAVCACVVYATRLIYLSHTDGEGEAGVQFPGRHEAHVQVNPLPIPHQHVKPPAFPP